MWAESVECRLLHNIFKGLENMIHPFQAPSKAPRNVTTPVWSVKGKRGVTIEEFLNMTWGIIHLHRACFMPNFNHFRLNQLFHINVYKVFRVSWLIFEWENLCFPFCAALKCAQKPSEWLFWALQAMILTSWLNGNLSVCACHECWPSYCLHFCPTVLWKQLGLIHVDLGFLHSYFVS